MFRRRAKKTPEQEKIKKTRVKKEKVEVNQANQLWTYNPHSTKPLIHSGQYYPYENFIVACFIDPGKVNCGIRICINNLNTDKITTIMQYNFNFMHESFATISGDDRDNVHYSNSIKILSKYLSLFQFCHYIVIERQLKQNYSMIRFSQHLISFFLYITRDVGFKPLIVEIDSSLKTRLLGAPNFGKDKPARKKWSVQKAIEILKNRGEHDYADLIKNLTKADEHGDCVSMDEVWWKIIFNHKNGIPLPSKINFE